MDGRILIVDAVATNRILLRSRLLAACYVPDLAADGASGLRAARLGPDLILLDSGLPDLAAPDVLRRLRTDPVTAEIPVVVMAAQASPAERLAAFAAGADDVIAKGGEDLALLARIRSLLRAREEMEVLRAGAGGAAVPGLAEAVAGYAAPRTAGGRSALVADQDGRPGVVAVLASRPDRALILRRDLSAHAGVQVILPGRADLLTDRAGSPGAALNPDVILVDADLDGPEGGLRLVSDLRSRLATRHVAVALLTGPAGGPQPALAFDIGVNDLWPAGTAPAEMALRLWRLIRAKRRADMAREAVQDRLRLAVIDPLTGLFNRRHALPRLGAIAAEARQTGREFAVMVVDLDRFKAVNDRWGHAAGDAVLSEVARRLIADLRPEDLAARIGGEEFLVALPDTGLAEARTVAERLCSAVEAGRIRLPGGGSLTVTVSIGLAIGGQGPDESAEAVLDRADRALLVSKSEGRNQVTVGRSAA